MILKQFFNKLFYFIILLFSISIYSQALLDSDGDGIADIYDLDDDNDGILDTEECPNIFANYTSANVSGDANTTSTVAGISWGSITGTIVRQNIGTTSLFLPGLPTSDLSDGAIFTPVGSASQPVITEALSGYKDNTNFTRYTLNLSVPVESITLHIVNWDFMRTRFTGAHREYLISGGTELTYIPGTRLLYDSDPTTVSDLTRDGYGSIKITSTNGLPLSQIVFEKFDDPNSINTTDGFQYTFSVELACDTDGDGIPDRLDLDSDGDGCPDVIEGGANFISGASYITGDRLNTTVNTSGMPDVPASTTGYTQAAGQTRGQSQNVTKNDCLDTDGDGVPNWLDLDDDNDGILDVNESACSTLSPTEVFASLSTATVPQTASTMTLTSTVNTSIPFSANTNYSFNFGTGNAKILNGINFASGKTLSQASGVSSEVFFRRNASATPANEVIWLESAGTTLPSAQSVLLSMPNSAAELFTKGYYNTGSDNTFHNTIAGINYSNLERIDVIFKNGLKIFNADNDYIILSERGANDNIVLAAITSLDSAGLPNGFGPVKTVSSSTMFNSGPVNEAIFRKEPNDTNFRPHQAINQNIGLGIIKLSTLGVVSGQEIFGYAILPADYNSANIADWTTYPTDTSNLTGGAADIGVVYGLFSSCNYNVDTDGDGIPDYLDLDSDGDGCPDVIEGGANFTSGASYITGDRLNTTVNASGVPGVPASTTGYTQADGQTIGQSKDATKNDCLDFDGDGIADWEDLDDDNDGILDTVECGSYDRITSGVFPITGGNTNTLAGWIVDGTYAASGAWVSPTGRINLNAKGLEFRRDFSTVTTVEQNLSNIIGNSTINFNNLYWNKSPQTSGAAAFVFTVSYAGTIYATITASGTTPTITTSNGATSNLSTLETIITGATPNGTASTPVNLGITLPSSVPTSGALLFTFVAGTSVNQVNDLGFRSVSLVSCKDTDGDGIPDYLDLDSDGDGCPDAIEGGGGFTSANLQTATGNLTSQVPNKNLGNTVGNTATTMGVPTIAGTGQSVGTSQNSLINGCVCYENPGLVAGQTYPVKHGITALSRASSGIGNWPMLRNSAYTVLESKNKGLVITRNSSPETTIAIPVAGMMVFDTDENSGKGCLKVYTGSGVGEGWKCFITPTCP